MKSYPLLRVIILIALTIGTEGCSRLDSNFFDSSGAQASEYKFRDYTGEVTFRLDDTYKIPDSLIHLLTLPSQAADESSPTKIYAVYIGSPSRIATDTVILYCHGKGHNMDYYWPRTELLANIRGKNHYGVLMMDYRGFGMSEGKPTEDGLYADVDACGQWLKSMGLTDNRLVMYGFSLGTSAATKLTAEPRSMKPSKLLLEAPFASADAIVQDAAGLAMYGSFFADLKINNAEQIKKVQQPFFWIHGVDDDFLSISSQGQVVYDHYNGSYKEAHKIPGAGHGDIPLIMGYDNYTKAVGDFISQQ